MNDDMKEYLGVYLKEAEEMLENLNNSLLEFEKEPENTESLREIARCAHTLKSSSASMGFQKIADLAHDMEDVLVRLEKREIKATQEIINVIFECFDALESGITKVGKGGEEPDTTPLLQKLKTIKEMKAEAQELAKAENESTSIADRPQTLKLINSIKVDVKTLDTLLNLVGELLIAKMKLQNVNKSYRIKEFEAIINELSQLIEEIQFEVTESRMIPLEQVFNRFPRMVRDIAKKENKEIDFIIKGSEIKLDRTVLDQLGEPLIHLLRNSIDHGIEEPAVREKQGKNRVGRIELAARREQNYVIIDVIDDGMGFDLQKIKEVAVKKGLFTREEIEKLSEKELCQIPFLPGFSTSDKVTEVSGRGVGLDVVKTRITQLNGTVLLETKYGKGTTFSLKLPPTMSIVKCLLITVSDMTYAIPITNILRIVKVKKEDIRYIEGNELFILDGDDIPLINLKDKFHLQKKPSADYTALIVEDNKEKVGIIVDNILGEQDIMIKSLGSELISDLKSTKGFAGVTILGDGKPALVLDISTLLAAKT